MSIGLQRVLAPGHVAAIDWSTLKLDPESYVDDELADHHRDLLFSAQARGPGERGARVPAGTPLDAEPNMGLRV